MLVYCKFPCVPGLTKQALHVQWMLNPFLAEELKNCMVEGKEREIDDLNNCSAIQHRSLNEREAYTGFLAAMHRAVAVDSNQGVPTFESGLLKQCMRVLSLKCLSLWD